MLVLSRKKFERIRLTAVRDIEAGEEIDVVVVRIDHNAVRLGIEAPRDFNIVRAELVETCEVQP